MGFQNGQTPAWLDALYVQKFFAPCSIHETAKKNEQNILCIDCCTSICPHCVMAHRTHRLLQVRRYVYHNVIRLEDLERLFDCSNVQAYTINAAKVVFIKKRPQNRHFKGSGNYCTSCDRCLQEPFIHCSLGCKVEFVLKHYGDLGPFLRKCTTLLLGPDFFIPNDFDYFGSAEEEMTSETPHSTVVDFEEPPSSCSGSSGSENNNNSNGMSFICTEFVRKKRTGLYVCKGRSRNKMNTDEDMATSCMNMMGNRRKRAPQRSPFC